MANALLALVSNSRNVNPYFAICQKTISGTTSGWSFFCRFGPSTLAQGVGGKADDLSRRPIEQAVLQAIMWCRPISHSLNTGSGAPYFAFAQYGLRCALFRFRSIRALAPAMCSGWCPCAHTPPRRPRLCARAGALARIRLRPARLLPVGQYAEPTPFGNA